MNDKEKAKLKRTVKELGAIKGRHTELVTVYIPAGFNIYDMASTLKNEQNTASNIKSKSVRNNVVSALEKIMGQLAFYRKTPENGLALFCGNVSEREGVADIHIWTIEPPEPLRTKLYWCSQQFDMGPLEEMVGEKEIYGIICLDSREGDVALLSGKKIESLAHMESLVPGKTRAGGQCLTPESLIQQADGNIVEIKDINGDVTSADFQTFKVSTSSKIIDNWTTAKNETYRIVTKNPRFEVKCSNDHMLFIRNADGIVEKAADELKEGDFLLIPEKISVNTTEQELESFDCFQYRTNPKGLDILKQARIDKGLMQKDVAKHLGVHQVAISRFEKKKSRFRTRYLIPLCKLLGIDSKAFIASYCTKLDKINLPTELTPELAQIIGYFVGDGNFEPDRLGFSEQRKEVAEWYFNKTRTLFNAGGSIRFREGKNYWQIRIYGRPIVRFFRKIVQTKHAIPEVILKSSDSVLAAFLKGLFDAEGYVSSAAVALGGNSEKLVKQLQMALLRFGILSGLHEYDSRKNPYSKKHRWTVRLCDTESVKTFIESVGFTTQEKQTKALGLAISSGVSRSRRILPTGKAIWNIVQKYGLNSDDFPHVLTGGFFRGEKEMSKVAFSRSVVDCAPEALKQELRSVLECGVLPVKIVKIEKICQKTEMIDITVENRNFIANGLIVHNSSVRFAHVREGLKHDWFKRIAGTANKVFMEHKDVLGIIISGSGPTKEEFLREELLFTDVKKKIIGLVNTSYTGSFGLEETVERGSELLKEASITKEKNLLTRFLVELQKPHGLAVYGLQPTLDALEKGQLAEMIFSESAPLKQVEFECGHKMFAAIGTKPELCPVEQTAKRIVRENEALDVLELMATDYSTKFFIVSAETKEGQQFLALSGIGGFLRFRA